jgi:ParB-like chromosome segregation protein Spo0J
VLAKQLNVRQTERWVRTYRPASPRRHAAPIPASVRELEERIRDAVGAPVRIVGAARGRLSIEFSSRSQLEAIAAKLIG